MTENMSSVNQENLDINNPFNLVDYQDLADIKKSPNGQNPDVSQTVKVNSEKKSSTPLTGFKSVIKFLARITGNPDPETGKSFSEKGNGQRNQLDVDVNNVVGNGVSDSTLDQDVTQVQSQKSNNFDSIMSGVTGVLDKIGNKFEEVTGLDLDAPIKNREEGSNPGKSEGKNSTE